MTTKTGRNWFLIIAIVVLNLATERKGEGIRDTECGVS